MILCPPHGIFTNMHCSFIKWKWIYLELPSCVRIGVCVWRLLMELNIFKNIEMIIISCDNKNAINLSNNLMFQLLESSQYLNLFSKWSFASYTPIITRLNCLHFHTVTRSYTDLQNLQSVLGFVCSNKFTNKEKVTFEIYKPNWEVNVMRHCWFEL